MGMHADQKPIMIFCCTRNSATATAKELARQWTMTNPPSRLWRAPGRQIEVHNEDLRSKPSLQDTSWDRTKGQQRLFPRVLHSTTLVSVPATDIPWRSTFSMATSRSYAARQPLPSASIYPATWSSSKTPSDGKEEDAKNTPTSR